MNTPNHYETLGIRPNASAEEIELAVKGRRSQYHPDRYSQGAPETVQWATQQMQLVNVAYQVLSNPGTRAAHDQVLQQALQQARHRSPESPGTSPSERDATGLNLRQSLAQAFPHFGGFDRMYLSPNIPLKKLSGALENYGAELRPADVVLLVDDTIFGGGGDGVLVTEDALYLKLLGSDRRVFPLQALQTLQTTKKALYLDGRKLIQLNMPDARGVDAVFARIRAFAIEKYGTVQQAGPSASRYQAEASGASEATGSAGSSASSASAQAPTPQQLFAKTKAKFGELYRALHLEDSENETFFASVALVYFETTQASLSGGTFGHRAYSELGMVYLLTYNILEVMQGDGELDADLLQGVPDTQSNGEFLCLLRIQLEHLDEQTRPARAKRNADRYFSGD